MGPLLLASDAGADDRHHHAGGWRLDGGLNGFQGGRRRHGLPAQDIGRGIGEEAGQRAVGTIMESLLEDISRRGGAAVKERAVRFDHWDRADYRLTDAEIRDRLSQLSSRELDDIRLAQEQVRNFAQHQAEALKDIEVETLPGVVLGHLNILVNSVGCYVPGGKYPRLPQPICP
jgi:sulfopropanediol 3-dehydrogenase